MPGMETAEPLRTDSSSNLREAYLIGGHRRPNILKMT
jgi:hypothetical protein